MASLEITLESPTPADECASSESIDEEDDECSATDDDDGPTPDVERSISQHYLVHAQNRTGCALPDERHRHDIRQLWMYAEVRERFGGKDPSAWAEIVGWLRGKNDRTGRPSGPQFWLDIMLRFGYDPQPYDQLPVKHPLKFELEHYRCNATPPRWKSFTFGLMNCFFLEGEWNRSYEFKQNGNICKPAFFGYRTARIQKAFEEWVYRGDNRNQPSLRFLSSDACPDTDLAIPVYARTGERCSAFLQAPKPPQIPIPPRTQRSIAAEPPLSIAILPAGSYGTDTRRQYHWFLNTFRREQMEQLGADDFQKAFFENAEVDTNQWNLEAGSPEHVIVKNIRNVLSAVECFPSPSLLKRPIDGANDAHPVPPCPIDSMASYFVAIDRLVRLRRGCYGTHDIMSDTSNSEAQGELALLRALEKVFNIFDVALNDVIGGPLGGAFSESENVRCTSCVDHGLLGEPSFPFEVTKRLVWETESRTLCENPTGWELLVALNEENKTVDKQRDELNIGFARRAMRKRVRELIAAIDEAGTFLEPAYRSVDKKLLPRLNRLLKTAFGIEMTVNHSARREGPAGNRDKNSWSQITLWTLGGNLLPLWKVHCRYVQLPGDEHHPCSLLSE